MKKITALFVAFICMITLSSCKFGSNSGDGTEKLRSGELIIQGRGSGVSIPVYDFDTFQPIATKSKIVTEDMQIVYEPLFSFDKSFNASPVLASGYVISSDGRTVTVSLKKDVVWHDGSAFSAYDVAYTAKCIKGGQTLYSLETENIESCEAVSLDTCVFHLKKPVPNPLGALAFPIIKDATPMNTDSGYIPIGTGPYRYADKRGASRITFSASETWHGGTAKIPNIEIKILKDKESAVYAFEANEVQCISSETLDLKGYTPMGHVQATDYVSNRLTFLGMNFYNSVLWGENTRQAIAYMIDKAEIVSSDMYGHAVAADIPVNPSAWFAPQDIQVKQDKTKAEELLLLDGWTRADNGKYSRSFNGIVQPLELELLTNSENDEKLSLANRIVSQLSGAGISVKVKAVPYTEYVSCIEKKSFDLFIGEKQLSCDMNPLPLVGSSGNYFTYVSSEMDALVARIGMTQDSDEKKQLVQEMRALFLKDMPFVPLFYRNGWIVCDNRIRGEIEPTCIWTYNKVGLWYIYQG